MEDRSRRRARLFTIVGLVVALAAGALTYFYANTVQTAAPPPEEKGPVVVAVRDLAARQPINASDVTIARYPVALIPATAATDPKEVIGKVLVAPVARGEPLLPIRWSAAQGQAAFTVLPVGEELKPDSPNYRAMSLNIPDVNAVGGNVAPGDLVDFIVTLSIDPLKYFTPTPPAPPDLTRVVDVNAKVILENVPILAKTGTLYTIRVANIETAEKLIYLQAAGGQISMVLRAPKDERIVATPGTNFPVVYRGFNFQVTQRINP